MKRTSRSLFTLWLICFSPLVYATDTLRIGTNSWPGYTPLYLAHELGYFDTENVNLARFPSSTEVLRALRKGSLDAAALTLDEVLSLKEADIPIKIVLVMDISNGGDSIMAHPLIADFQGLKGKRIAVESSAVGAYMITRALEINGMALKDIMIVHIGIDKQAAAYLQGRVDAAVTFEPVRTRIEAAGAHEVFSSKEIPGEIVDVLVVQEHILKGPQLTQAKILIDAWFKALRYLQSNPAEATRLISQQLHLSDSNDTHISFNGLEFPSLEENWRMLGGDKPGLNRVLPRLKETMIKNSLLFGPVQTDNLLDTSLLEH